MVARVRAFLVLLPLIAATGSAFAQTEHSPVCRVNPGSALDALSWTGAARPLPGSKVLDDDLRELEELGAAAVVEGDEVEDMVAFTFDDGPKFETTPKVLAALERYQVPATFFVVGWRFAGERESTRKHAALLREILAAGHVIGNHTYHHANLAAATTEVMRREIDDNTRALVEHLGYRPHTFRPPYGAVDKRTREHLRREGLTEVRWGVDTQDFQPGSMRTLRKRTLEKILENRGGVVLMHDTKEATARHIAGILDDLEAENCRRLDRLASGQGTGDEQPIIPVSIHYFIRERDGTARPVPDQVKERTERYRANLPERCAARAAGQDEARPPRSASTSRDQQAGSRKPGTELRDRAANTGL